MPADERLYDIVVLGATGYTGKYTAEAVATHLPTDLRWAVAGRNGSKLSAVVEHIKSINPNRQPPGVEIATLSPSDLNALARKTKLIISTVGPFHLYGEPVVEACAKNGTHYVDSTGETPWTLEMIKKYDSVAKANNAILIPQCAVESAVSDILTYLAVSLIRKTLSVGVRDVVATCYSMVSMPSGGSLLTLVSILGHYPLSVISKAHQSWALSPIAGRKPEREPLIRKIFGVHSIPELSDGVLTNGPASDLNRAITERTWSLLDGGELYGKNFRYREYATVRNSFRGVLLHWGLAIGGALLLLPPFRWLVKKLIYQPGEGPSRDSTERDHVENRALAVADCELSRRAFARFRFEGSAYDLTGVLMSEAAIVILRNSETAAHKIGGGILTPATLGQPYIDRLQKAGIVMEATMLEE